MPDPHSISPSGTAHEESSVLQVAKINPLMWLATACKQRTASSDDGCPNHPGANAQPTNLTVFLCLRVAASVEAFSSDEGLLYEQLSGLCRDAAWMKSYVASSLLMTKELFQASHHGGRPAHKPNACSIRPALQQYRTN